MSGPMKALPGNARNGSVSGNPTSWSTDTYDYALVTRVDWHPVVWRRPKGQDAWVDSFDLSSTALGLVNVADSHYAVSIAVDHLERIWIAGNAHASVANVVVSDPGSMTVWSSWTPPSWLSSHSPYTTYHVFNCFSDGQILWTFDGNNLPDTGLGRDWNVLRMNMQTDEWEPSVADGRLMRIDDHGLANVDNKPDRSYLLNHFVDKYDRLHMTGIWRMATSDGASMLRSFYIYSDDRGTVWKNIQGVPVTLPLYYETTILEDEATIVVSGTPQAVMVGGSMCLDSNGYPVFTGFNYTDWMFVCRWNGTQWIRESLASWGTIAENPSIGLRYDGALLLIFRNDNNQVIAYNYDDGPSTVDKVVLGNATTGTPDGVYTFESGATYQPAPIHATRKKNREALQFMIPEGDEPRIRTIGGGLLVKV